MSPVSASIAILSAFSAFGGTFFSSYDFQPRRVPKNQVVTSLHQGSDTEKTRTTDKSRGGGDSPYETWPWRERRAGGDRRGVATPLLSRFLFRGQRRAGRRFGERDNIYVDRLEPGDIRLGLTILLLNLADAAFTLVIVGTDLTREANPLARWILDCGTGWFLFSKGVVVGLCLLFLMLHRTFAFVKPALWVLACFYSGLLAYHFYLLGWLAPLGV